MKLHKFVSGNVHLKRNTAEKEAEKSKLIRYISERSDRYGDKLLEFMDIYRLNNLQSATVAQLTEYIATHLQLQNQERVKNK